MARIEVAWETLDLYSPETREDILFKIMEQVDIIGEDNLDLMGAYILEVLKDNYLIFQDGILVRE